MLINSKNLLLLLVIAAGIPTAGYSHSATQQSVPTDQEPGRQIYVVPKADDPWRLVSTLDSYYEDEFHYVDYYHYKIEFDPIIWLYTIQYSIVVRDNEDNFDMTTYDTYGSYPEVDLGIWEGTYIEYLYERYTELVVDHCY